MTFDNSGGGSWSKYINIPITTTPSEYAQYKVVIEAFNVIVYSAKGTQKTQGNSGIASDFWNNVKSDGSDIRVFNQNKGQRYFWIEEFDYNNSRAIIWVKVEAGDTELNIAYGNPSALPSSYNNPKEVGLFFTDFEKPVTIKAYLSEGSSFDRPSNTSIKITGSEVGFNIFNGSEIVEFTEGIVEFRAKFYSGGSANGGAGFVKQSGGYPFAIFTNRKDGTSFQAMTRYSGDDSSEITDLGSEYLDEWHVFKIKRDSSGTYYYIDDNLVASHHAGNDAIPIGAFTWGNQNIEIDWIKVYDLNGNLLYEFDFNDDEFMAIGDVEVNVSNSIATIHATSTSTWGVYVSCGKVFKTGMVARAKAYYASYADLANENAKHACAGCMRQMEDGNQYHVSIFSKGQNINKFRYMCGDGTNYNVVDFTNTYYDQWVIEEIIRYEDNSKVVFRINGESLEETSIIPTQDMYIKQHSCGCTSDVKTDWIAIFSTNDPANFGTPTTKTLEETGVFVTSEDAYHGNYSCKFVVVANSSEGEKYVGIKQSQDLTGFNKVKFALKITELTGHCAFEVWAGSSKLAEYTSTTSDWEEKEVDVSGISGTQEVKFIARAKDYAEDRKIVAYLDKVVKST